MARSAMVATFAICMANLCLGQDVTGNWVGTAPGGGPLGRMKRITVRLSKDRKGELKGVMYSGAQQDVVFECTSISLTGSKLSFTIKGSSALSASSSVSGHSGAMPLSGSMSFVGVLSDDGNSIEGWLLSARLKLERVGRARSSKSPPEKVDAARPAPEASLATTAPGTAPGTTPGATPGTTPGTTPGGNAEPSAILSRALAKLAGTGLRLLQYTCLETIERTYYSEPVKKLGMDLMTEAPTGSCGGRGFSKDGHLALDMEDRLRLEVAVAGGKEIHSWAGASGFDSRSVFELVRNGPKSTGAFGTVLIDIFENPGAHYTFAGRKSEGAQDLIEYAFEVSLEASHFFVSAGNEWKRTAYRGSFEIDAANAELARVNLETAELAPETQMCRLRTVTDYRYAQIGNGQFLIPRKSEFDTVAPNASETRSVTTFSACHEYTAESSLVFDGRGAGCRREGRAEDRGALFRPASR